MFPTKIVLVLVTCSFLTLGLLYTLSGQTPIPQLSESDNFKVQMAYKEFELQKERVDRLFAQWLLNNTDARAQNDLYQTAVKDLNSVVADVSKRYAIDTSKHSLDLRTGRIVSKATSSNVVP